MTESWKSEIIALTELPEARARAQKIDASFFPPVPPALILAWEGDHAVTIPAEIRHFLRQSDGLEACQGDLWPVLLLTQWEVISPAKTPIRFSGI